MITCNSALMRPQFGGNFDDDDDFQPPAGRGGGFMGGFLGGTGWAGQPVRRANPQSYDEYFKAYSVAMLPGKERPNLSYGGKSTSRPRTTFLAEQEKLTSLLAFVSRHASIRPRESLYVTAFPPRQGLKVLTSSLIASANLDLESPWMFHLRNPSNPAASTHAGVLEFIAEEGIVHLPYWVCRVGVLMSPFRH